jgi:hypothetical protein
MGLAFDRTGSYTIALGALAVGLVVACLMMLRLGSYRYPQADHAASRLRAAHSPA